MFLATAAGDRSITGRHLQPFATCPAPEPVLGSSAVGWARELSDKPYGLSGLSQPLLAAAVAATTAVRLRRRQLRTSLPSTTVALGLSVAIDRECISSQ